MKLDAFAQLESPTLAITDRAYLIHEGKVLVSGTREFLVNDPQSRKIYLGEDFNM